MKFSAVILALALGVATAFNPLKANKSFLKVSQKELAGGIAAGVLAAAVALPGQAVAADGLVLGTPLEVSTAYHPHCLPTEATTRTSSLAPFVDYCPPLAPAGSTRARHTAAALTTATHHRHQAKLANFGAASYPVFNSITDVSPLADKFGEFVDSKVSPRASAGVRSVRATWHDARRAFGSVFSCSEPKSPSRLTA